jgi:hypothetical protein
LRQIAVFLLFSVIALGAAMTVVAIDQRLAIEGNGGHLR